MKRKFDFALFDTSLFRDIIRYYPRRTHVHSFDENPPKTWEEVYKVYYSWAIIRQHYGDDEKIERSEFLLEMPCDECSQIPDLSEIIKYVMKTGETFDEPTFGQPAADWMIKKERVDYVYYDFEVFDNWTNQGYRFAFTEGETLKFCTWLDKINQYALEHGEEI